MFTLFTLEDDVRVEPQHLGKPTEEAIKHVLEDTFIDRVIYNVGLVVTLYDVLKIGEGVSYPSQGATHYKVTFRVVVFKPFPGELVIGNVKEMSKENGLRVDLGFFKDVHILPEMLQQPAEWAEESKEWMWKMENGSDPAFFYQKDMPIRVKVQSVKYHPLPSVATQKEQRKKGVAVEGTKENPHTPMVVIGRADGTGLGMIRWDWG